MASPDQLEQIAQTLLYSGEFPGIQVVRHDDRLEHAGRLHTLTLDGRTLRGRMTVYEHPLGKVSTVSFVPDSTRP